MNKQIIKFLFNNENINFIALNMCRKLCKKNNKQTKKDGCYHVGLPAFHVDAAVDAPPEVIL